MKKIKKRIKKNKKNKKNFDESFRSSIHATRIRTINFFAQLFRTDNLFFAFMLSFYYFNLPALQNFPRNFPTIRQIWSRFTSRFHNSSLFHCAGENFGIEPVRATLALKPDLFSAVMTARKSIFNFEDFEIGIRNAHARRFPNFKKFSHSSSRKIGENLEHSWNVDYSFIYNWNRG